jgi:hypothetical protein
MNPKLLETWLPYESLMSIDAISARILLPSELLKEEIEHLVPSIELGIDGPIIKSLLFVTKNYMCEIRCSGANEDFDFALRGCVENYRVNFGRYEVSKASAVASTQPPGTVEPQQPVEKIIYETAEITLLHTLGLGLRTSIFYAGTNRNQWFSLVKSAFPPSLIPTNRPTVGNDPDEATNPQGLTSSSKFVR